MKNDITVVSLGPGDPDLLNIKTIDAIKNARVLILRTSRHPIIDWLNQNHIVFSSLDHIYDTCEDFDDLDREIAAFLIHQSSSSPVVYAVPDAYMDRSVRTLFRIAARQISIHVIPGMGSGNVYLSEVISELNDSPVSIVSSYDFAGTGFYDPDFSILITELDNPMLAGQIKIILSEVLEDDHEIILIREENRLFRIPLYELDRDPEIDHRTSVFIPSSGFLSRHRFVLNDLILIMNKLRAPQGCPWDRIQTHDTLRPYLVEEAWECVAAIEQNDTDHLCEELGDLLFQIIFHSAIARAFDEFTLNDVISSVCGKMIRRHPHVFSDVSFSDADSVSAAWETIKQEETGHRSVPDSLEDVSDGLPSLKYASKILKKLKQSKSFERSRIRILSDIQQLTEKIITNGVQVSETELGVLLLLCVELCSQAGIDGELALHLTVDRLKHRIRENEKIIIKGGKSFEHLTFDELGVYLQYVEGEIE